MCNQNEEYLDTPVKKLHVQWKSVVTKTFFPYWTEKFQTLKPYFGTLKYSNTECAKLGSLHPLIQIGSGSV